MAGNMISSNTSEKCKFEVTRNFFKFQQSNNYIPSWKKSCCVYITTG
jgi:hypothetical protein